MAKTKAIGYTRLGISERPDGLGLVVQAAAIEDYCMAEDLRLVTIVSDAGRSGSNDLDKRRGLAEGLARIEGGEASALVVYRLDRLAQHHLLQETIQVRLEADGGVLLSVSEPTTETKDSTRILLRQFLGGVAQYERAVVRGRIMVAKATKVADGGYGGGRPPYGYKASGGSLVANEDESAIVEIVVELRRTGVPYRTIASVLDDAGHTTRGGGRWNPSQVRRIALRSGVG